MPPSIPRRSVPVIWAQVSGYSGRWKVLGRYRGTAPVAKHHCFCRSFPILPPSPVPIPPCLPHPSRRPFRLASDSLPRAVCLPRASLDIGPPPPILVLTGPSRFTRRRLFQPLTFRVYAACAFSTLVSRPHEPFRLLLSTFFPPKRRRCWSAQGPPPSILPHLAPFLSISLSLSLLVALHDLLRASDCAVAALDA